eukprot:6159874-Pleurochrysis_carterae.AAC.1
MDVGPPRGSNRDSTRASRPLSMPLSLLVCVDSLDANAVRRSGGMAATALSKLRRRRGGACVRGQLT